MSQTFSLQQTNTIITVASWEDRFSIGVKHLIENVNPTRVLMFYYQEYADWSQDNRQFVSDICSDRKIEIHCDKQISFKRPVDSWRVLVSTIEEITTGEEKVTLDITTMPREAIWSICYVLFKKGIDVQYVYFKPEENGYGQWLSRDPGRPRILYRLAGIQHLGRQTALVVQTGYDVERVKQLVKFYEPEKVILGLQIGEQLGNIESNRKRHLSAFKQDRNIEIFDIDGYKFRESSVQLYDKVKPLIEKYNVILSSLGPKIGSLSLFMIKQKLPDVAMSYAPSNEFNKEYSKGIGECIHGIMNTVLDV